MRVAHLDMTDPNQHCPPGFRLITSLRRVCGRVTGPGCASTTFPVMGWSIEKSAAKLLDIRAVAQMLLSLIIITGNGLLMMCMLMVSVLHMEAFPVCSTAS